jgi:hypothetical protein
VGAILPYVECLSAWKALGVSLDVTNHLARSLIEHHGVEALALAERAAENVRQLGMLRQLKEWNRVIDAIKKMLENGQPPT